MLSHYKILSVTHKTVNLKHLKHYVVADENGIGIEARLKAIRSQLDLGELFYLQTCNRVMYFFTSDAPLDESFVSRFLQSVGQTETTSDDHPISDPILKLEGRAALNHLMEVSASIDSLVIGEREILRQLREAYQKCLEWQLIGDQLKLALDRAVLAAKAVYSKTGIGEKPVSVVSLAIRQMLKTNLPKDARILMIGAGQTNTLVTKFLAKYGYENLTVFNRSESKASLLAEMVGGKAASLSELSNHKGGFDCMIVCTGAVTPIIDRQMYTTLLAGETTSKILIDLAIPHNVDKEVLEHYPVRYIEIEGLKSLADVNLSYREQEVVKARNLLSEELDQFPVLLRQRQLEIALRQIPTEVKAVREKAFNEVFQKEVASLDQESRELLERMMTYMEKKCIGIPMKAAREAVI